MKKLSFLLFVLSLTFKALSQDCGCDHFITLETSFFNGEIVSPGETICLQNGVRGSLKIKNIAGEADNPIRIINCGGQVKFNDPFVTSAILFDECTHFQLTGTGSVDEYGFYVQNIGNNGLIIRNRCNHFEIDHIQIEQSDQQAIYLKDNPNCELTLNEGFYTLEDANLHHLFISNCGSGISIGHPQFGIGTYHPFCEILYPYGIENVQISHSRIENLTEGEAISLYGCNGSIFNNEITDINGIGIQLANECHVLLERNSIQTTTSFGLRIRGGGDHKIHSNLFIDNGDFGKGAIWIECLGAVGDVYENTFQIEHNSIVNSGGYNVGIINANEVSALSWVRNNIFCEPGLMADDEFPFSPYYFATPSDLILVDHNLLSDSKYEVGFANVDDNNFNLQHFSSAINQGVIGDLAQDFSFQIRNLAGSPDLGAYEYVPEPLSHFGSIDLVGLYVDDFKNILGNLSAETELLEFAEANGFNYLLLYNLSYIHTHSYDLTDPTEAIVLANFIERAKSEYGIVQVGAVGEKDESFDKIQTFNSFYGDNWFQKFDVLNLEFEFWTDPGSAVFSYYCENYMAPGGYPCTNTGAFNFYSDQLELIDERAHEMGIISEIYLGYTTDLQMINLSERTDRVLLHHYRTTDTYGDGSSIYNYHTDRIHAIAQSDRKPAVMPIFSSRAYHMGPWLLTHSLHQPMDTWLNGLEGYNEDETEGVSELPIAGFQWYRYTSFLDLVGGFHAPEEKPEADTQDGVSIQTNFNSQTKALSITQAIDMPIVGSGSRCEIYTSTGALVLVSSWNEVSHQIDLSNLSGGVYFLSIKGGNGEQFCRKISVF